MDVLLFGTMAGIGPVVREGLERHGLEVALVDFAQNTFRDFWGYGRGLGKAIAEYNPKIIFPIGDSLALSKLKSGIESGEDSAVPPLPGAVPPVAAVDRESTIALLSSKVASYEFAAELGIKEPRRFFPDDIPSDVQLIFKRDISFGGSGVHRPRTIGTLRNMISRQNGAPYLIEEYIEGEDLSVDCVRGPGIFRAECYVSKSSYTQGPSTERTPVVCPEAMKAAEVMLDALDYKGVCGMDFKRNGTGLYFLECNPRFTGGIRTQIERGFDIPFLLYSLYR